MAGHNRGGDLPEYTAATSDQDTSLSASSAFNQDPPTVQPSVIFSPTGAPIEVHHLSSQQCTSDDPVVSTAGDFPPSLIQPGTSKADSALGVLFSESTLLCPENAIQSLPAFAWDEIQMPPEVLLSEQFSTSINIPTAGGSIEGFYLEEPNLDHRVDQLEK